MIRVNGESKEWHDGLTVRGLLGLEEKDLHRVLVVIDDAVVPPSEYSARLVPDGADVRLVHLASGG